jgi:hypothetical protein
MDAQFHAAALLTKNAGTALPLINTGTVSYATKYPYLQKLLTGI